MTKKAKKRKVKPTPHFQADREEGGHDISQEEAEAIIDSPVETETQNDGRVRHWGNVEGRPHLVRVVTSAFVSASQSFIRLITAHDDSSKDDR